MNFMPEGQRSASPAAKSYPVILLCEAVFFVPAAAYTWWLCRALLSEPSVILASWPLWLKWLLVPDFLLAGFLAGAYIWIKLMRPFLSRDEIFDCVTRPRVPLLSPVMEIVFHAAMGPVSPQK
jgi:hypothetical protein